jgi:succinoglycan biosynthesis protein ExoA
LAEAPLISVCIATGRRHRLLDACLSSLAEQESPPSFELLVAADADADVAVSVRAWFPDASIVEAPRALPGALRNALIQRAQGEWLLFLDDDVTIDRHLLRRVADAAAANPDVDVLGGPNYTPRRSSRFQLVQGAVLASIVASGPVRRRYGYHPRGRVDERFFTLCNLAIRRSAMLPFATDLVCAEENAVLSELSRRGSLMHYDPELVAYHERRATYKGFASQMHKYGRGRGQLIVRQPATLRPSHVAPATLIAYLAVSPLLALLSPVALVPVAAYAAAVATEAAKIARSLRRPGDAPLAAALVVTLHACYGTGVVRGAVHHRTGGRSKRGTRQPMAAATREP